MTSKSKPLPPYRALLIVDVKDFSAVPGAHHAELTEAIPEILRQTFRRGGLERLWNDVKFEATTGDGYVLGFAAKNLPFLLHPFLPALQDELDYRAAVEAVSGQPQALRMRVSVNVGPMTDSGAKRLGDGSGDARIENHRLLDSRPVRELLERSGPSTRVGAIVSSRAFDDAVASGFTDDDRNEYVPVDVEVKSYRGSAYVRVPKPTGDLLKNGFAPALPAPPRPEPRTGGIERISGGVGNVFNHPTGPISADNVGSRKRGGK
ncbi:hypothetical protein ACFFQW_08925 [Umezawaea endophytica]|uniref:Guanylate cyclase domain-containing protein n=1 Tax=Umezawaea endophytica TaxID=1654476 RepID=A0A9X2VHA1_9PSEU|nr:hypothetical protein [Umezawaea endophytica]MCS7476109.1 hypothetical protein [Umezawaea endophytica]